MLKLKIEGKEYYNEITNEFIDLPGGELQLEHSLYALAAWESKWKKPFLTDKPKTLDETISYIKCMTLNPESVSPHLYSLISQKNLDQIYEYMGSTQTATWFTEHGPKQPKSRKVITAEIIYYWMVSFNIPFECQYWHLDRLITLIRVCDINSKPPKKMSKQEAARQRMALNNQRLKRGKHR